MIVIPVLYLIVGFVLLVKGADFFVEGASSIAKRMHIPTIVIGLTIVAFGTSAPELAVSLSAAIKGSNDIAILCDKMKREPDIQPFCNEM